MAARSSDTTPDADRDALLAACRLGDRRAMDAVLRPLLPALEQFLRKLVRDSSDVEDLLQSSLVAAIAAFPRFRADASVKTWLLRIATCQVHDLWRSPARRRRVSLELVAEPEAEGTRVAEQAEARRRLARVYEHLAAIAPKKRIAFILHVIDGRPMEEVASLMNATVFATRSRVLWGRRALVARLRRDPVVADLAGGESP